MTARQAESTLIENLRDASAFPHPVRKLELLETHISWVLLTGSYAYKIKKPVDLGFLDYSTLQRRQHFCQEEIRLNSRLAPHIYLETVPITGTPEKPRIGGEGPPIEYAVKMNQFDQRSLLDRQITEGRLRPNQIDALAETIAAFHQKIRRAPEGSELGHPDRVQSPALENFTDTRKLVKSEETRERLAALQRWTEREFTRLRPLMQRRREQDFIRECHGDLHLGNVAFDERGPLIFDGIEFNDNLLWIDVMNELAFLFMDLEHRGREDFAWRALNRYLEATGDYEGVNLLRYYLLYRVMVRAKVAAIRLSQSPEEASSLRQEFSGFLRQAEGYAHDGSPHLLLTRGVSGVGKSYISEILLETLGAVRLRSDVERKRLFGVAPEDSSGSPLGGGIYSPECTAQTFAHLRDTARHLLESGQNVIVDATFLRRKARRPFLELGEELGLPVLILDIKAHPDTCRSRLKARSQDASEADLEVFEAQIQSGVEPLAAQERDRAVLIDGEDPDREKLTQAVQSRWIRAGLAP